MGATRHATVGGRAAVRGAVGSSREDHQAVFTVTARRTASFRRCGRGADSFPEGGSYGYRETGVAQ